MTIKKAISLPDDIYNYGIDKTQKLFGGNFSKYICYLISKDKENLQYEVKKDMPNIKSIDDILDM